MSADPQNLTEIEERLALARDNLRQLVEQAAAFSGAADEERMSSRISEQEAHVAELLKQRDALVGDGGG